MGKQPAVLIIVRHGTRLDQANKDWHDTAEQPWDSPLSYGGWIQSQNLGYRIATELNNLDVPPGPEGLSKDVASASPRPRKRRKVIIHSSPYLRCIQTSIGVAAGIRNPQDTPRIRPIPTPFQRSSLSKPPMSVDDATSPPNENAPAIPAPASRQEPELPELKIDAWLGEWLSSGYFAKSKPPPSSKELVKGAKQGLKRPPEEIKGADMASTIQEFEEVGWVDSPKKQNEVKAIPIQEKTGLRAMAAKGYSMPRRTRTISSPGSREVAAAPPTSEPVGRRPRSSTYSPPIPTYSIAPQDAIPIGFVAHARDACLDADFDWDSQKAPLEWGDGGQYEEEWSTMHRRFRNGLQSLLSYYEFQQEDAMDVDDELDEELVVILVTHQAGCNALIRLVTGAPALHDVGTASLTLATRKPGLTRKESRQSSKSPTRRRGSLDLGFDEDFDMKIIASTEHLRSGSNPLGLNSPRLAMSPAFASRRMVGAESLEGFSIGDPMAWRSSSSSAVPRNPNVRGHNQSPSFSEAVSGAGLWSGQMHVRTTSTSSDISVDPRSSPIVTPKHSALNVNTGAVNGDAVVDDWVSSPKHASFPNSATPMTLDDQSTWQPAVLTQTVRLPIRKGSTILTGNALAGTGLWGSPVNNPGGVKEGTPHSRGSFGMSDAAAPMWGPRSSSSRLSAQMSKTGLGSTIEDDES